MFLLEGTESGRFFPGYTHKDLHGVVILFPEVQRLQGSPHHGLGYLVGIPNTVLVVNVGNYIISAGRTLQSGGGVKKSLKAGASAALGSAAKSASDAASRNQKTAAQRKAGVTQTLKAKKYTGSVKKHLQGLGTAAKKAISSKFYGAKRAAAGAASRALGAGAARLATENTSMLKLKGLLKEQGNPYGAESEQAIKDRIKSVSELRKRMVAQGKSPQEIAAAVAKASQGK